MKLSDCINRINQILNYPALEYNDVSAFFDQAIVEINTNLKIGIPLISNLVSYNKEDFLKKVITLIYPIDNPDIATSSTGSPDVYYYEGNFYIKTDDSTYSDPIPASKNVFAYNARTDEAYIAIPLSPDEAVWSRYDYNRKLDVDLEDYLTDEWVVLFLIPYVCFKYAVRAGDSGQIYNTEFSQGFLQLQTSYNIPSYVILARVAGQNAYKDLVLQNMDRLYIKVPTRAITYDMKAGASVTAKYGGFYENGGWGL